MTLRPRPFYVLLSGSSSEVVMKVSDVMTRRVISINPEASIVDAMGLMMTNHISGLPVIDREGKLVGMVSEGDFLRRAELATERHRSDHDVPHRS